MSILSRITGFARSPSDPKIISTGPSIRPVADDTASALGWFSLALGMAELLAPHSLTRILGMEGRENLVRAYGAREIAAGVASLSTERTFGLWSRVGGDALDIATLLTAYRDDNPKKNNVGIALAVVVGVLLIDLAAARASTTSHAKTTGGKRRDYRGRSGFPKGLETARGYFANRGDKQA